METIRQAYDKLIKKLTSLPRWQKYLLLVLELIILWAAYLRYRKHYIWYSGTDIEGKTLWEFLDLLIIPIFLAVGAYWFNRQEKKTELELALAQQREAALQSYLDKISDLILEKNLLATKDAAENSPEASLLDIAQVRTVTTLRQLDPQRQNTLFQFLRDTGLHHFVLVGASMIQIDLVETNLSRLNLNGGNLTEANLTEANLYGANLTETNLYGANLTKANLTETNLTEADLSGADLRFANLRRADLRRAQLDTKTVIDAKWLIVWGLINRFDADKNLSGADLSGADLSGADLSVADLRFANLRGADLRFANLSGADLSGADLSVADLSGANLSGANLSGANLSGADLRFANLRGADLSVADLSGADLSMADLSEANLSGANLSEANLEWANLTNTTITPEQLNQIKSLRNATLPDGTKYTPPPPTP